MSTVHTFIFLLNSKSYLSVFTRTQFVVFIFLGGSSSIHSVEHLILCSILLLIFGTASFSAKGYANMSLCNVWYGNLCKGFCQTGMGRYSKSTLRTQKILKGKSTNKIRAYLQTSEPPTFRNQLHT